MNQIQILKVLWIAFLVVLAGLAQHLPRIASPKPRMCDINLDEKGEYNE